VNARRVAVVVPCFNDGDTLENTLASVDRQDEPVELVVVDDGSTDPDTLQLLDRIAAGGRRVLRRPNGGLSAARMTGVAGTSAPYVFPLDADDELAEGALRRLADALDAHPEAKLAWGDTEIFDAVDLRFRGVDQLDAWHLTYVNDLPGTTLIRRDALLEAGGYVLPAGYEDWDLWLSFVERGWNGVYVPGLALRYRRRQGRMNEASLGRHGSLYADIRARHPELFRRRRALWRRSRAPLAARILLPLVGAVPFVAAHDRHRLYLLFSHPRRTLAGRTPRGRS
jgi:glycosyltransferase involved in cell wall biosynthesis